MVLCADASLPDAVFGPVDLSALRRLAARFFRLTRIGEGLYLDCAEIFFEELVLHNNLLKCFHKAAAVYNLTW